MQSFISAVAVIDIPELSADDEAVVADYLKDILAEKSVRQRTHHSRNAKILLPQEARSLPAVR